MDSPPEGFRVPQWTPLSHDASVDDFIAAAADPSSRSSALTSSSEACTLTGVLDSVSSSSRRLTKDRAVAPSRCPSYLYRSLSRRCLSKLGSRRLFGRQKLDGADCLRYAGRQNRALTLQNSQDEGGGHQSEGDGKLPMTLSQLVASSTREAFGWSDVNSVSQLSWNVDEEGLNAHVPLTLERIRADTFQFTEDMAASESDDVLDKCGLCCQALSHRSLWCSQAYGGSHDLPVVSVLACGHVFHAECLDRNVPASSKSNPPCPQCMQTDDATSKGFVLRFDRVKNTVKPIKRQLLRMLKAKSYHVEFKTNEDVPGVPRSRTGRRKGALLRSLSKLHAPSQAKVLGSENVDSR